MEAHGIGIHSPKGAIAPLAAAVQSFRCLLKDLATLCKNRVRWESASEVEFERLTLPTPLQRRAFELLRLSLAP